MKKKEAIWAENTKDKDAERIPLNRPARRYFKKLHGYMPKPLILPFHLRDKN